MLSQHETDSVSELTLLLLFWVSCLCKIKMIGKLRQNFTEASASVGLILATALIVCHVCPNALPVAISCPVFYPQKNDMADESNTKDQASSEVIAKQNQEKVCEKEMETNLTFSELRTASRKESCVGDKLRKSLQGCKLSNNEAKLESLFKKNHQ